jgi:putative restriction endonuclease
MPKKAFGHIPGIEVGTIFPSRVTLKEAGLHSQSRAGISGAQPEGADAVVLSGEYEDDEDRDTEVIYTGQGGRDPATGKQVADQKLTRGNLGLVITRNKGLPLRVIRKVDERYRYDGLYRVADAWHETGKSGYVVWRYRLLAFADSGDAGHVGKELPLLEDISGQTPPKRTSLVSRVVRDTKKSREIKERYKYTCQICSTRLIVVGGPYAEAAHIRPLGAPHNGSDTYDNLICLCPNHHVLFDLGGFVIADDLTLIGVEGKLSMHATHKLNLDYVRYHREHYCPQTRGVSKQA